MEEFIEIALKLTVSLIMGGLIGLERDITGHEAGLRTQILVALGSATFIMIGDSTAMSDGDMSRIIQGVATGLGFLGAGAIIKEGITVKGLTTAASIWVTATIGLAVGLGKYEIALGTFAFAIVSLSVFGFLEKGLRIKSNEAVMKIVMDGKGKFPTEIINYLKKKDFTIKRREIKRMKDSLEVTLFLARTEQMKPDKILKNISQRRGVLGLEWEDLDSENILGR